MTLVSQVRFRQEELLTSSDVIEATGLSYRQLEYWTKRGIIAATVRARGSGSLNLYHPSVVDEIGELLDRIDACPFDHTPRRPRR